MKKTLLASTITIALSLGGQAWAQPTNTADRGGEAGNQTAVDFGSGSGAVATGAGSYAAFSPNNATSNNSLTGIITGVAVTNIGNTAANTGSTTGGAGGPAGNDNASTPITPTTNVGVGVGFGGDGGAAGNVTVDAGTFDMSNSMANAGHYAAGILMLNQNSGPASLVQQGINVQANLSVSR